MTDFKNTFRNTSNTIEDPYIYNIYWFSTRSLPFLCYSENVTYSHLLVGMWTNHKLLWYTTWGQFHQSSTSSFYLRRSQKRKKRHSSCHYFLRFWDLHAQKLLIECWWNWPQVGVLEKKGERKPKKCLRPLLNCLKVIQVKVGKNICERISNFILYDFKSINLKMFHNKLL